MKNARSKLIKSLNGSVESAACTIGYFYAVVPPQLIDPVLKHHMRFGARPNELGWPFTIWIGVAVLVSTFALARPQRLEFVGLIPVPMAIASFVVNFSAFPKEFPHLNVSLIVACWSSLTLAWQWIKLSSRTVITQLEESAFEEIEFAKELVLFFRTLAFGLIASFLAILITSVSTTQSMNNQVVGGYLPEVHILMQLNGTTVLLLGCFALFGPILESLNAWRTSVRFLRRRPIAAIALLDAPTVTRNDIDLRAKN